MRHCKYVAITGHVVKLSVLIPIDNSYRQYYSFLPKAIHYSTFNPQNASSLGGAMTGVAVDEKEVCLASTEAAALALEVRHFLSLEVIAASCRVM